MADIVNVVNIQSNLLYLAMSSFRYVTTYRLSPEMNTKRLNRELGAQEFIFGSKVLGNE
jgi:hypothetical protein